jgi:hypothetical protein
MSHGEENRPKQASKMSDSRYRFLDGFEGFTLAAYTRLLGWSKAEVQTHGQNVKRDAMNPRIHAMFD